MSGVPLGHKSSSANTGICRYPLQLTLGKRAKIGKHTLCREPNSERTAKCCHMAHVAANNGSVRVTLLCRVPMGHLRTSSRTCLNSRIVRKLYASVFIALLLRTLDHGWRALPHPS